MLVLLVLLARGALADDPAALARRHFEVGLDLIDRRAWDSALAQFLRSAELHATANALKNAAVCRRELGRFDEALDTYDALLAQFGPQLSDGDRHAVEADMSRIERFTGELVVTSDVPGATIIVDDRARGTTPLAHPLRLTSGTRALRVEHAGRARFEAKVLVTHGDTQRIEARLGVISRLGTLRVAAANAQALDVVVDGTVVGRTPWQGTLVAATHTVALRDAKGDLGSEPRTVDVQTDHVAEVTLPVHTLSGALRIEPTPSDAHVLVDGAEVARGSWGGLVATGKHDVRVESPWYEPEAERVRVTSTGLQVVRPILTRVPRAYLEVSAGPAPLYDTGVRSSLGDCNQTCIGYTVALRAGYLLSARLGVELGLGLFSLPHQSVTTLRGTFENAPVQFLYGETANTLLYFVGPSLRYQIGDEWPLTLRLFAGVATGSTSNITLGKFDAADGYRYYVGNRDGSTTFWTPALEPEVRFGHRFAHSIVVDVGLAVMMYIAPSVPTENVLSAFPPPPRPSLQGGLMYAVPLTVGIRVEL